MLDYKNISIHRGDYELCGNTVVNPDGSGFTSTGLEICKWQTCETENRRYKFTVAFFKPHPDGSCHIIESVCDRMCDIDDWDTFGYLVRNGYDLLAKHGSPEFQASRPRVAESPSPSFLQDSGERITYGTGKAMREPTTDNGRFDLLCTQMMYRQALHNERGSIKYADRNWEKGMPVSRCIDSALRHVTKYMMGCNDEPHLDAAIWNLAAITYYEHKYPELMDLPERASMSVAEIQKYCCRTEGS